MVSLPHMVSQPSADPRRRNVVPRLTQIIVQVSSISPVVPYSPIPQEVWASIHGHLGGTDLKNLALVSKHVGAFASTHLFQSLKPPTPAEFLQLCHNISHRPDRARSIRSLTVAVSDTTPHANHIPRKVIFEALRSIAPLLVRLNSLVVLGEDVAREDAYDVIAHLPRKLNLEEFRCESEVLLRASWHSLRRYSFSLRTLSGSLTPSHAASSSISLEVFQRLRLLETSTPFIMRLAVGNKITHLAVDLNVQDTVAVTVRISKIFGAQLVSLRMNRTFSRPMSNRMPIRGEAETASESPLLVCVCIEAPRLQVLDIRDVAVGKWAVDIESLGDPAWAEFPMRVPQLHTLLWQPVWAVKGIALKTAADAFALAAGQVLDALQVSVALETREYGVWGVWGRETATAPLREWRCPQVGGLAVDWKKVGEM